MLFPGSAASAWACNCWSLYIRYVYWSSLLIKSWLRPHSVSHITVAHGFIKNPPQNKQLTRTCCFILAECCQGEYNLGEAGSMEKPCCMLAADLCMCHRASELLSEGLNSKPPKIYQNNHEWTSILCTFSTSLLCGDIGGWRQRETKKWLVDSCYPSTHRESSWCGTPPSCPSSPDRTCHLPIPFSPHSREIVSPLLSPTLGKS